MISDRGGWDVSSGSKDDPVGVGTNGGSVGGCENSALDSCLPSTCAFRPLSRPVASPQGIRVSADRSCCQPNPPDSRVYKASASRDTSKAVRHSVPCHCAPCVPDDSSGGVPTRGVRDDSVPHFHEDGVEDPQLEEGENSGGSVLGCQRTQTDTSELPPDTGSCGARSVDHVTVASCCPCSPCLLYTSPSPRDASKSRMPSSA